MNKASCLCGEVSFQVSAFLTNIAHCHCKDCQKFHGAAFSTFAEVKKADLNWLSGKDQIKTYKTENGAVRSFCSYCGSSLFFESIFNTQDKTIEVSLAAFDELAPISVNAHIFCRSKVSWLTFNDDLPKFDAYRR